MRPSRERGRIGKSSVDLLEDAEVGATGISGIARWKMTFLGSCPGTWGI